MVRGVGLHANHLRRSGLLVWVWEMRIQLLSGLLGPGRCLDLRWNGQRCRKVGKHTWPCWSKATHSLPVFSCTAPISLSTPGDGSVIFTGTEGTLVKN